MVYFFIILRYISSSLLLRVLLHSVFTPVAGFNTAPAWQGRGKDRIQDHLQIHHQRAVDPVYPVHILLSSQGAIQDVPGLSIYKLGSCSHAPNHSPLAAITSPSLSNISKDHRVSFTWRDCHYKQYSWLLSRENRTLAFMVHCHRLLVSAEVQV